MMFLIIEDRREYISSLLKGADEAFSYKGLEVYCRKDRCYLDLKDGYCLSDGRKNVCLEYGTYSIETPEGYYQLLLHVYRDDSGFEDYAFYRNREQIRVAAREADILYQDPYMGDSVLMIRDGKIDADIAFSVNGKRYDGFRLEEGDLICFLGLRIFYYGDFLYMNSFLAENRLERYLCKERKISYPKRGYHPRYRLKRTKVVLDIPELEEYEGMEEKTGQDILKTILPNSIMSLAVLSTATMSFYSNLHQGYGFLQLSSYLISPVAMLVTGVLLPLLLYRGERKKEAEKLKTHREGYLSYLKDYEEEIDQKIGSYVQSEQERDFSVLDEERDPFCLNAEDPDFLCLSIGRRYEKREFINKRSEDEQIDKRLEGIKRKLSEIGPLPLMVDLKENKSLSIVCKRSEKDHFFTWLLLQLAYRHSCEDLYIGVYAKQSDLISSFYDLPHLFYEDRRLFFFDERSLKDVDLLRPDKPLVLFMYENSDQVFSDPNIRVIRFLEEMDDLKKERSCVVEYLNQSGVLYGKERISFIYRKEVLDLKKGFARLGRYNIAFDKDKDHSFRKLFGDLDLSEDYQKKPKGLRADFAYEGDQLLSFDLHEKKQGPHGLIGGSTGSGKSELIISMLLSLCIRYSPDYFNIVLVDYKGGGIREALTNEGRSLPHIIAAVSNLEDGAFERLIIALKNECLRRQMLFNEMSSLSGMAVSGFDSYLESWSDRYGLPSLAHLLIVIDEFAELKKEDPEGIRELISISRIGRSLGVHLILATQKPAGNIDEEIWSNSHFKIALKVFEEKDSNDLIRQKDAAYLKEAGSFILKVDDHLSHAQSIYAKKDFCDHEPYEVCVLDPTLEIRKRKSIVFDKGMASSSVFVKRINEACDRLKMKTEKMDFLPPEPLERKRLGKGR
ncbi:MAG: hypothetical protein K5908_01690, partial [Erysipelotrichaceae bacterium]|nr:hypothetical protein [Erysipelotrichaceae bacterium]